MTLAKEMKSMPDIRALHGLRYDLGHIGSLAEVISPAEVASDPTLVDSLFERHPANVIRILANREEPGDDQLNNRFTRARRFLTDWQRQGVLQREPDPAIYVYHQDFDWNGQRVTRRGFLAGLTLEEIDQQQYEALLLLLNQPAQEALEMLRATQTNVRPGIALYADSSISVQQVLENQIATATPLIAKDEAGVVHRLWPVTDHQVIGQIREKMAHRQMFRNAMDDFLPATLNRYELAQRGELTPMHPANFMLTAFFELTEPGFEPKLRFPLAHAAPRLTSSELVEKLGVHFDCQVMDKGLEAAAELWEEMQTSSELGHFGIYCGADQTWVSVMLTADGQVRMEEATPERDEAWRDLDENLWEWLVLTELLETADAKQTYARSVENLVGVLQEDQGGEISLAAMIRPVCMTQYQSFLERQVSFFHKIETDPAPVCGLVINRLA